MGTSKKKKENVTAKESANPMKDAMHCRVRAAEGERDKSEQEENASIL